MTSTHPGTARLAALVLAASTAAAGAQSLVDDLYDAADPENYGRRLVEETYAIIGPEAPDPALRFAGNNLACSSCHADGGIVPEALPLAAAYAAYPAYVARSGRVETIEDRVDDCMVRSMNGEPLPEDGREMAAIVAYLRHLGETAPASERGSPGSGAMPELDRPADPDRGARFYAARCAACHGDDGQGERVGAPGDALGYLHPPLWGPDSFNDGAGMARLTIFANFVHRAMPETTVGSPETPPEVAWDIAAFALSHPRPAFDRNSEDYPKRLEKPVDTPYGPYADGFDEAAHRYGPFAPIRAEIDRLIAAQ